MEKRIYNDNLEQFLKETTDDFRMYPSRKVWHSIYNDIHPARKWPSLAVLLLLISSLMFIGVNNTNKGTLITASQNDNPANPFILEEMPTGRAIAASELKKERETSAGIASKPLNSTGADNIFANAGSPFIDESRLSFVLGNLNENSDEDLAMVLTGQVGERELRVQREKQNELARMIALTSEEPSTEEKDNDVNAGDKEKLEQEATQNKKKKGKSPFAYQFYATPSVGFRSLNKNTDFVPANPAASMLSNPENDEAQLSHSSAVNIETGANVLYNLTSFMRIKAGIQLNYTNYHISAYSLHHPTLANLLVHDVGSMQPVLVSRMSTLSSQPNNGEVQNLNNNTYQFSLPVGADFKLAGNSKMQWFAGATIQPTFITGGNAFLISADRKNYVADPTMLRRFNMNGGIETFISYKVGNGVTVNAGPQFRYQLMSSYEDQYTYDEKLYNIGLKLGITTSF